MRIKPRLASPLIPQREKRLLFFVIATVIGAGAVFSVAHYFLNQSRQNQTNSKSHLFKLSLEEPQWRKLLQQQKEAEQTGISPGSELDDLPATLTTEKKTYPVKVRLHGKNIYHFEKNEKFSIRVNVEGNEYPLGLKEFSFIVPNARDNLFHFTFLGFLKRQKILAPEVQLADLSINGKNKGQYFLEESIGSPLAIRQGRELGTLIFIKGQRNCDRLGLSAHLCRGPGTPGSEFPSAAIVGEFKRKYSIDPEKRTLHEKAVKIFESVKKREVPLSSAFKFEKMADYLAILVLFGASEFDYNDMAFFYDSKQERFEPIGKHVHIIPKPGYWWVNELFDRQAEFVNLFLGDEQFLESFLLALKKWVQPGYLESALEEVLPNIPEMDPRERYDQAKLGISVSSIYEDLIKQRDWLKVELDPITPLQAYLKRAPSPAPAGSPRGILIYNIQKIPVRVKAIKYIDQQGRTSFIKNLNYPPLVWKNTVRTDKNRFLFIPIDPQQLVPKRLRIVFEVMGTGKQREIEPYFWENELDTRPKEKKAALSREHFKIQPHEKRAILKEKVEIGQKLIVPEGWTLQIEPGAHLIFKENGSLLSYSPLVAEGSETLPIQIEAYRTTGPSSPIQIISPKRKSIMKHVNFFSKKEEEAKKPGAFISLQKADLQLREINFFHLPFSSALEIQDGALDAEGLQFYELAGSALTADRSNLSLKNIALYKIRQNGISVRKSKVAIQDLRASQIDDTALEVLDLSDADLWDVEIDRVKRALLAESASQIKLKNFDIRKSQWGLVASAGGEKTRAASRILARTGHFDEVSRRYQTDNDSLLSVDASFIRP